MAAAHADRMRWVACVLCVAACAAEPSPPDEGFTCDDGTIMLPAGKTINASIDANDCIVKITGLVNGSITATGGVVHVVAAPTVNGELVVDGASEVVVAGSQLNGGIDVEHSLAVTVEDSQFNGEGQFVDDGTVTITNSFFNASLTIRGAQSCTERDNDANGPVALGSCAP